MEIKKKNYPKGDLATSGDIIIDGDSYLLIGWEYIIVVMRLELSIKIIES